MNKLKLLSILFLAVLIGIAFTQSKEAVQDPNHAQLVQIIPSECNGTLDPDRIRDRIVYKELKEDTMYLHLGFSANCCQDFYPDIKFKANELHVLLDNRKGDLAFCACNCCFELTLVMTGIPDTSFKTWVQGDVGSDEKEFFLSEEQFKTYPEVYDIINGDTINRYNKYHLQQGPWYSYYDSSEMLRSIVCYDGQGDNFRTHYDILWRKRFYKNGQVSSDENRDSARFYYENGSLRKKCYYTKLHFWNAVYTEIDYYENGQLKSKCKVTYDESADEELVKDSCVYWDRNGVKVEELPKN